MSMQWAAAVGSRVTLSEVEEARWQKWSTIRNSSFLIRNS